MTDSRESLCEFLRRRASDLAARLTRWAYEPFPSPDANGRDPWRWCIDCGCDCYEDEPNHALDCGANTGLFRVTDRDLGMRGLRDPYAHGMSCAECGAEFRLGDYCAHQRTEEDDVFVTVCVGCQILHPETTLG